MFFTLRTDPVFNLTIRWRFVFDQFYIWQSVFTYSIFYAQIIFLLNLKMKIGFTSKTKTGFQTFFIFTNSVNIFHLEVMNLWYGVLIYFFIVQKKNCDSVSQFIFHLFRFISFHFIFSTFLFRLWLWPRIKPTAARRVLRRLTASWRAATVRNASTRSTSATSTSTAQQITERDRRTKW